MEREFRQVQTATRVFTSGQGAIEHLVLCGPKYPLPDLVLLDRTIPDGPGGEEVVRAARAMAHLVRLPMLIICGSDEPEHIAGSQAAGADGCLLKPPEEASYPQLVRQVLAWWQAHREQELLRSCCAELPPGGSLVPSVPLSSGAMTIQVPAASPGFAVQPQSPLTHIHQLLHSFLGYVAGGNVPEVMGLFADRKLVEISRACREEGIDEQDALSDTKDSVLVRKRDRVIRRLMTLEWSDTELLRKFQVGRRTIQEQRRVWREEVRKSCGVVARTLS